MMWAWIGWWRDRRRVRAGNWGSLLWLDGQMCFGCWKCLSGWFWKWIGLRSFGSKRVSLRFCGGGDGQGGGLGDSGGCDQGGVLSRVWLG